MITLSIYTAPHANSPSQFTGVTVTGNSVKEAVENTPEKYQTGDYILVKPRRRITPFAE